MKAKDWLYEQKWLFLNAPNPAIRWAMHTLQRLSGIELPVQYTSKQKDDSSFVTGDALVVDGGLTAQLQDAAAGYVERGLMAEIEKGNKMMSVRLMRMLSNRRRR